MLLSSSDVRLFYDRVNVTRHELQCYGNALHVGIRNLDGWSMESDGMDNDEEYSKIFVTSRHTVLQIRTEILKLLHLDFTDIQSYRSFKTSHLNALAHEQVSRIPSDFLLSLASGSTH